MSPRTKLAIAACFNSTLVQSFFLDDVNVKVCITGDMEDYFHYSSVESSQFDQTTVLAEIEAATPAELRELLLAMGKGGDMNDGQKWHAFIDEQVKLDSATEAK